MLLQTMKSCRKKNDNRDFNKENLSILNCTFFSFFFFCAMHLRSLNCNKKID
ncbi:hypothetical protein IC582_026171 [Cucumis melo]